MIFQVSSRECGGVKRWRLGPRTIEGDWWKKGICGSGCGFWNDWEMGNGEWTCRVSVVGVFGELCVDAGGVFVSVGVVWCVDVGGFSVGIGAGIVTEERMDSALEELVSWGPTWDQRLGRGGWGSVGGWRSVLSGVVVSAWAWAIGM